MTPPKVLLACYLLFAAGQSYALVEAGLADAQRDARRFNELSNVLRCMVCQNQSIADSNAGLAKDLRNQVVEKLNAGQSNEEIIDYMVVRYGDYILYRPPFKASTALLWLGPFILMIIGLVVVFRLARGATGVAEPGRAIADKQARLRQMLADNEEAQS